MRTTDPPRQPLFVRWLWSWVKLLALCIGLMLTPVASAGDSAGEERAAGDERLQVSGRYPHLAMYNHGRECGIGAVVPWAGKLWAVTYPPHAPRGSDDKLYEITPDLTLVARPESVGGTPANRMIHRESNQLFMGPYVIDRAGDVRVIPYEAATGRPTATMRHLTDPADKVYTFTMEEGLYEIDVATLEVKTLFKDSHVEGFLDYLPGYHGKGGYTGQGRVVVANNGKKGSHSPFDDSSGCLAQWDGEEWTIVEEHQFNEVTGPGGIRGASTPSDPIWATGWDKASVLLKLLDDGTWSTYRLPIGSYDYMASHGWYTEWPRIRQVGPDGEYLMNIHGLWFDFPRHFSNEKTGALRPIASHLKITADFCRWRDSIVFGCDDTAITGGNQFVNQSQSNLWFADWEKLADAGRPAGWGGVWVHDRVEADSPSLPFHFAGYSRRMLHLTHGADKPVAFSIELDRRGGGNWSAHETITVPAGGYEFHVFPRDVNAEWVRIRTDRPADDVTAYFHYGPGGGSVTDPTMFDSLADITSEAERTVGIVRPRGGDLGTLQMLAHREAGDAVGRDQPNYYEIGPDMELEPVDGSDGAIKFLKQTAGLGSPDFSLDAASAIVTYEDNRYRLPISDQGYRKPWSAGWPRGIREVVTERRLFNCGGTFYVLPHKSAGGVPAMKPVCTHNKRITDFCSWRGMLVLAGVRTDAMPDEHCHKATDEMGLWFGDVDDLWKMGEPRGRGGPWLQTPVEPDQPSDPYLMTGFNKKTIALSHDGPHEVTFTIEVDFLRDGTWKTYETFKVPAGETVTHEFPPGYSAHWVRVHANRACAATAQLTYQP
ncbi:MAG: hypothetical protein ACQESR_16170 [Planctomycetota bacterium]